MDMHAWDICPVCAPPPARIPHGEHFQCGAEALWWLDWVALCRRVGGGPSHTNTRAILQ